MQQAPSQNTVEAEQLLPSKIETDFLEQNAMWTDTFFYESQLSEAEARFLGDLGFKVQRMIDERAQAQKDFLKLLKVKRFVPVQYGSTFLQRMSNLVNSLEANSFPDVVNVLDSQQLAEAEESDLSTAALLDDFVTYLKSTAIAPFSIQQLRDEKAQIAETLAVGFSGQEIAAYFVGFSDVGQIGVYNLDGFLVASLKMNECDFTYVFSGAGNQFLKAIS